MKALTIPASRPSKRELTRSISATVSNYVLRKAHNVQRAVTALAITATLTFFAALGMMHVPSIVISGLTALMAVALMPSVKEGGES